jgi:hypothetical protein
MPVESKAAVLPLSFCMAFKVFCALRKKRTLLQNSVFIICTSVKFGL